MKKLLVGSLLLAVVLMGTGYAYWTDQLKVEGTIKTGELNVKFVDSKVVPKEAGNCIRTADVFCLPPQEEKVAGSGYMEGTSKVSDDGKSIEFTVNKLYPGGTFVVGADIKNVGTIDAKVTGVTVSVTYPNGYNEESFLFLSQSSLDGKMTPIVPVKFLGLTMDAYFTDFVLKVNETKEFKLGLQLQECASDKTENQEVKVKITFEWSQFNKCINCVTGNE